MGDVEKDVIGPQYLWIEKSLCFLENAVFVVEVLVSENNQPKVMEAKDNEIKNLEYNEYFEEVEDVVQEQISIC